MKIIAGIDKNFQGEVVFSPGYSVGYWSRSRSSTPKRRSARSSRRAAPRRWPWLKEYEEINMKLCEPMSDDEMARMIERQGELYEKIDHANGWEL